MTTVPVEITWTTGQVVTAAQLNANVRDAINFLLAPPFAIMRQTVAQSMPNAAFGNQNFDVEDIDRDGGHSTVTNTSRYTSQTVGWYGGESYIQFAASGTGRRLAHWNVNGGTVGGDSSVPAIVSGGGNTGLVNASRRIFLNVGDFVEIQPFQDSGGALNTITGSYFSMLWISN